MMSDTNEMYCVPFEKVGLDDIPTVGGKRTASLGEMIQTLTPLGAAVPGGFAVTASAYDAVLDRFHLRERLKLLLEGADVSNLDDLSDHGFQARQMMMNAGLPEEIRSKVMESYQAMSMDCWRL